MMIRAALYEGASTCMFISKALISRDKNVHRDGRERRTTSNPISTNHSDTKHLTKHHRPRLVIGTPPKKEIILVTGSSGFLGQHVIKLLQEHADNVEEIVLFDIKPYQNKLGHETRIPMRQLIGDVCELSDVREALKTVNSVIHAAGCVQFSFNAEVERLKAINVKGTANVIQASIEENVTKLLYASSVDVVIGNSELNYIDESCPVPKKFLFNGYPESKHEAEVLVLKSHGRKLIDGHTELRTLSLRPSVMYGEEDPYYITSGLQVAESNRGVLTVIGGKKAEFQQTYAGNVAWAFLCALSSMSKNTELGGKAMFITDDTPIMNSFDFTDIFLKQIGCRLSTTAIPYPIAYMFLWISESICWLVSPLIDLNVNYSLASLIYINTTFTFSRRLAEDLIGYKPLFTYEESINRSSKFYKRSFEKKSSE